MAGACLGAGGLLYAFRIGDSWGYGYAVRYGAFAASPGELALWVNMLTLVLPAGLLLAWATAVAFGPAVLARFDRVGAWPSGRVLCLLGALAVIAASTALRQWVLHDAASTDDENAYVFQAQLLSTGRTWVPSAPPSVRGSFDNVFIVNDGRRYSAYFLGHPLMLAVLGRVGLDEAVGAIEAACTFLLALAYARRALGARATGLTGLLLLTSPFFLALSATQLSQPTSGLALMILLYAAARIEEAPRDARWWAAASAGLSFGMVTRPQIALVFSLPWVLPLAWRVARGRLRPGAAALIAGAGVLVCGAALFLWANAARTGHPLRTGYQAYWEYAGPASFPRGIEHSVRALVDGVTRLDFWLHGWPISLAFVAFFRRTPLTIRMAGSCGLVALAYAATAVPTVSHVGPVYYGELIPCLCLLGASGIERVVDGLRAQARQTAAAMAAVSPAIFTALGLVTFLPIHLHSLERMGALSRVAYDLAELRGLDHAVVLYREMPTSSFTPGSWAFSARNPDPDLRDSVLFVKDVGAEGNARLLAYLKDRTGWALVERDGKYDLQPVAP